MNIIQELEILRKKPKNEKLINLYFLDCCKKLIKFRSSGYLSKNLLIAQQFLNGNANQEQIHKAEWEMEAEAFEAEYYSDKNMLEFYRVDENIRNDLVFLKASMTIENKESEIYIIDMAYFINCVFSHIEYTSN